MSEMSEIRMQVMWNRLISVVEEQAMTLLRTAFSTSVREAGDLSAGVFDPHGQMLAQAVTGTPGHVNTMAEAVLHFIEAIPRAEMFEGDTYVTNDPWQGTGHLHDITMVSPSFLDGELVGVLCLHGACRRRRWPRLRRGRQVGLRGRNSDPDHEVRGKATRSTATWCRSCAPMSASRTRWWATSIRLPPATRSATGGSST